MWSNHIYSTSLFIRHEHGAVIYRIAPGMYRLTATASGGPHTVGIPMSIPSGATRIAYVHTHPNSNSFAPIDKEIARDWEINAYVVGPNLWLQRYNFASGIVNGEVARVTLRNLTVAERAALEALYRASWNAHLPNCNPHFGCANMQWPTNPWPPR